MSSDLLAQLQKLSGAIDRHKSGSTNATTSSHPQRSNKYINPQLQAKSTKYTSRTTFVNKEWAPADPSAHPDKKEVTIGGVEFESSKNKLTRKGAPVIAKPTLQPPIRTPTLAPAWSKKSFSSNVPPSRRQGYKPRVRRRQNQNMSLNNVERSKKEAARARKATKQCSFFCKTGLCGRGKKCFYQHDPKKVAICPRFMKHDCPHDDDHCLLSHDPTPERVSLCVHFANQGLCKNGVDCLFPHFHVGPKTGVCRDFAVLGYCEKGIDCEQQHLRECPTFAEKGKCDDDKCKLPHVIRANANRKTFNSAPKKVNKHEKPVRFGISFSTQAPETVTPSSNAEDTEADSSKVTEPSTNDFISFAESSDEEEDEVEDNNDIEEDEEDEQLSDAGEEGEDETPPTDL